MSMDITYKTCTRLQYDENVVVQVLLHPHSQCWNFSLVMVVRPLLTYPGKIHYDRRTNGVSL